MSRLAVEAYEDGEMPKSKWSKKAIVEALKYMCDELDLMYDSSIENMSKSELFDRFLYHSSWHHTSKFFNETDFYKISIDEVAEMFRPLTETEVAEKQYARDKELANMAAARETMKRELSAKKALHLAYKQEHGFLPDTVAAFAHEHPEFCIERVSRKGNLVLSYIDEFGKEQCCLAEYADRTTLYGYDATKPGSFDRMINLYLSRKATSLKDEAEQARASSATLATHRSLHDVDCKASIKDALEQKG